jgi:hypothetical protein
MKLLSVFILSVFILSVLTSSSCARDNVTANDQARFIAGLSLPADSPLEPDTHDPGWQAHSAEMDAAWIKCEQKSLAKARAWAAQFIGRSYHSSSSMFYLFSGPDILYANTMFPNASTYVLCGIEPIGSIPDLAKLDRGGIDPALANLRRSLSNVLRFSYFITKDMRVDLADQRLAGTLPIFYFFLARLGCTIQSVDLVSLDATGNLHPGHTAHTPGIRIAFANSTGTHALFYFQSDLSNSGVRGGGVLAFCRQQGPGLGLLKAASYLMHTNEFSVVRDFLVTNCRTLVQDDSGIPVRYFDPVRWQMRYFGNYVGPTELFAKYYQPDLAQTYAQAKPAELDFVLSYRWNPKEAIVMVGTQTGSAPPPKAEPVEPVGKSIAPPAPGKKPRPKTL